MNNKESLIKTHHQIPDPYSWLSLFIKQKDEKCSFLIVHVYHCYS